MRRGDHWNALQVLGEGNLIDNIQGLQDVALNFLELLAGKIACGQA